ncbi:MAG: hypothetical protein WBV45_03555 [Lutimonas sp.]
MSRNIKLIWDFRGPEAEKIAEHHAIHLREFSEKDQLPYLEAGTERISELHSLAFITVAEEQMITFRDALIPQRAVLAKS